MRTNTGQRPSSRFSRLVSALALLLCIGGCEKLRGVHGETYELISVNGLRAPWNPNGPCTGPDGKIGTGGVQGTKGRLVLSADSSYIIESDLGWTCGGSGWAEGSGTDTGSEYGGYGWRGAYSQSADTLSFTDATYRRETIRGRRSGPAIVVSGTEINGQPVEMAFERREPRGD